MFMQKQLNGLISFLPLILLSITVILPLRINSQTTFNKVYGDITQSDYGYSLLQTSDGGYIIAGTRGGYSGTGNADFLVIKTDALGNVAWEKLYSQVLNEGSDDYAHSIYPTMDGGYIVLGESGTDGLGSEGGYLLKIDGAGNQQWTRFNEDVTWGIAENHAIIELSDGTFFMLATDALYKLSSDGTVIWSQEYDCWDFNSFSLTSDGGLIIAGSCDPEADYDMHLMKTDASGNEQWSQYYGGFETDEGWTVHQTTDGGYIASGVQNSTVNFVIKTDNLGNEQWSRLFGSAGGPSSKNEVRPTSDGGYIFGGTESSKAYMMKLDGQGNTSWEKYFNPVSSDAFIGFGYSIIQAADGGYALLGWTADGANIHLIKTDNSGNTASVHKGFPGRDFESIRLFPNPFHSTAVITLSPGVLYTATKTEFFLYTLKGQAVRHIVVSEPVFSINRKGLANGLYFMAIQQNGKVVQQGRVILE